MKVSYSYLNDVAFLKELAKQHVKTYYVKISVLNWKEQPVTSIEGQVISANLNIDGQSSLRRTANLSIAIDDTINQITNTENVLSINKKMCLEIGYVNTTQKYTNYPILWFPLGIYVIISCSISESSSGLVASLQLQDKMCLLNGTAGGTIPAAADLHILDTIDEDGNEVTNYVTMYQIIQELVHHWGGQQLGKIIISDLDNRVKQAMKWGLEKPLYYVESGNQDRYFMDESEYQNYINSLESYSTQIFTKGQDVGYIYVDFIYPGELIADAGASVTDMLDQIIQVLGNYEYFYDLDGNFIFQEKKNFLNNAQSKYILDAKNDRTLTPDYIASTQTLLSAYLINMTSGTSVFQFEDSDLVTSYSNTPQYGAIKNDFVIWGVRTGAEDVETPLRYHLAIDNKPVLKNITYKMFNFKEYKLDKYGVWIMPIIVIGEDGTYNGGNPSIISTSSALVPSYGNIGVYYYILNQNKLITSVKDKQSREWVWKQLDFPVVDITPSDWRTQLLVEGAAAQTRGLETNYYYPELKVEWPKIYDIQNGKYYDQVVENPSSINYYLDLISAGDPGILQISVDNIGRRSYVSDNGKNTNCVFENWIPDLILIKAGEDDTDERREQAEKRGQRYSQVPASIYNNLKIGGSYYSAYEEIRQTLHEFTNYNESISLQTIPLYFLQPNTRITVNNPNSDISGDYLINSLSFSLNNDGLLTINASKAVEKI